jgi:hypothetical protein
VKITLRKLIEANAALGLLAAQETEDMAAPFKLAAIASAFKPLIEGFSKVQIELIKKLGVEQADKNWRVLPENEAAYGDQIAAIIDEEVSIHIPYKIKLADLERAKLKVSGVMLAGLAWLLIVPDAVTGEAEPADEVAVAG